MVQYFSDVFCPIANWSVCMNKKMNKIFNEAKRNWYKEKYTKSFHLYLKCANKGHIPCYDELAYMYHDGIGTCTNLTKALYWYKKAEKAGVHCHLNIADIYTKSQYKNVDKEKYWLKKGIERKDSSSMYNMAIFYRQQNKMKKMKKWFIKSYKANDGSAAFELAKFYLSKGKIKKGIKYLKITINHPHKTLYEQEKSELYLARIKKFKKYT